MTRSSLLPFPFISFIRFLSLYLEHSLPVVAVTIILFYSNFSNFESSLQEGDSR
jgi:hypothetical protein